MTKILRQISYYAHNFFEVEKACHFERSEKSKLSRFFATLEMTAATSISEALYVTSADILITTIYHNSLATSRYSFTKEALMPSRI
jgi:hypothetical protein